MQDHVVTGLAGQHLGLGDIGGVVGVVDRLDPGGLAEIVERGLADIICPVIDMDHLFCPCGPGQEGGGQGGSAGFQRRAPVKNTHTHLSSRICH